MDGPSSLQRRLKDTLQNPALHCLPVRQGPSFGNTELWHTSSLLGLLNAAQPTDTFISQQVHCARLKMKLSKSTPGSPSLAELPGKAGSPQGCTDLSDELSVMGISVRARCL